MALEGREIKGQLPSLSLLIVTVTIRGFRFVFLVLVLHFPCWAQTIGARLIAPPTLLSSY